MCHISWCSAVISTSRFMVTYMLYKTG
uniref:Uncharacterized protein n=1 Tax=Arundo donax TaxID=35708 RepID=A0A0A9B0U8_ARUDO